MYVLLRREVAKEVAMLDQIDNRAQLSRGVSSMILKLAKCQGSRQLRASGQDIAVYTTVGLFEVLIPDRCCTSK
jgi:hypothetical protein